jgi:predicted site-specific integrase-resolvase
LNDLLIGWKEISDYLQVSEKTAMRYERERKLPVKKDPAGHPIIKKEKADEWRLMHLPT